ncbi:MAG: PilZ domain-containing protein [Phycisphaerales bacterium]|nr:PilZ domain-containing protein [Phycisphaerales bacterium]
MSMLYEPATVLPKAAMERRRGLRICQHRPIKVYIPSAARYLGGQTRDISASGLQIELPRTALIQPGRLLTVHVGLDQSGSSLANRRGMIPARVVWVSTSPQGAASVNAGVEFLTSIKAHADAA